LLDYGFVAVVASSFGDIFKNNSSKQGLVTVELDEASLADLIAVVRARPSVNVTIDVEHATIEVAELGWRREFALAEMTRQRLINGWDDIGLTLRYADEIGSYEGRHDQFTASVRGVFDADGRAVQSGD
jgi:3-isopropylmalate/(R)-2-methylmalate dehydratase small subunit